MIEYITNLLIDKEREAANQRRKHPIDKNYTTITLYNASVVARDPANPTVEERYAAECLYRSSSEDYPGNNFSAIKRYTIVALALEDTHDEGYAQTLCQLPSRNDFLIVVGVAGQRVLHANPGQVPALVHGGEVVPGIDR